MRYKRSGDSGLTGKDLLKNIKRGGLIDGQSLAMGVSVRKKRGQLERVILNEYDIR